MGRNAFQTGFSEVDALGNKAAPDVAVEGIFGRQQIHGGVVFVGIGPVAVHRLGPFHAPLVLRADPEGAGIGGNEPVQPPPQPGIGFDRLPDGLLIAHHTGFQPFPKKGTAAGGYARLRLVQGAKATVHVLRRVSIVSNFHFNVIPPCIGIKIPAKEESLSGVQCISSMVCLLQWKTGIPPK